MQIVKWKKIITYDLLFVVSIYDNKLSNLEVQTTMGNNVEKEIALACN